MSEVVKKKAPRKKANKYNMPEPIPSGEIVTDSGKKKWIIGPSIGVGGFGEIYSASEYTDTKKIKNYEFVVKIEPHENGPLFVEKHFYMRNAKKDDISDWMKSKKLKSLGMPRYIGSGSHECNGMKYRFLVMERFGRDIWNIFLENGRSFPEQAVFQIALQILNVIEYIHSKGYVHADIKGANILVNANNQVYLVDFGLASHYTMKEFKNDPKKAHNGTIEYTSRDAHNGVPTRRGDLEILAYNMLHWLGNTLPWEKHTDVKVVQQEKEKFMSGIPQVLKKFTNIPESLTKFFQYVISLKYDSEPDYNKCRTLFTEGIKKSGGSLNGSLCLVKSTKKTPTKKNLTPKVTKSPPKRFRKSLSPTEIEEQLNSSDDENETVLITNSRKRLKNIVVDTSEPESIPSADKTPKNSKSIKRKTPKSEHKIKKTKIKDESTIEEKENEEISSPDIFSTSGSFTVKKSGRAKKVINYSEEIVSSPEFTSKVTLKTKQTVETTKNKAVAEKIIKKRVTKLKIKSESSWKNFPTLINSNVVKPGEYKKKS